MKSAYREKLYIFYILSKLDLKYREEPPPSSWKGEAPGRGFELEPDADLAGLRRDVPASAAEEDAPPSDAGPDVIVAVDTGHRRVGQVTARPDVRSADAETAAIRVGTAHLVEFSDVVVAVAAAHASQARVILVDVHRLNTARTRRLLDRLDGVGTRDRGAAQADVRRGRRLRQSASTVTSLDHVRERLGAHRVPDHLPETIRFGLRQVSQHLHAVAGHALVHEKIEGALGVPGGAGLARRIHTRRRKQTH